MLFNAYLVDRQGEINKHDSWIFHAITLGTVLFSPAEIPSFRIMTGKCAWSYGLVFCTCTGFDAPFEELLAEKLPSLNALTAIIPFLIMER